MKQRLKKFLELLWMKLFVRNLALKANYDNILLIFPSGIGNTILANGAIKSLRRNFPNSRISAVYLQKPTCEILQLLDNFEELYYLEDDEEGRKEFLKFLNKRKFNISVIFFAGIHFKFNFILYRAGIPTRVGFYFNCEWVNGLTAMFLTHFICYDFTISEFENNLRLLSFFNIPLEKSLSFKVKSFDEINFDVNERRIGVHIGRINDRKPGWKVSSFIDLINRMEDFNFYIFGGEEEKLVSDCIDKQNNHRVINLIGKLTIEQTIYGISRMNLFISNDTGLMHMAASQGVPLVAIFGPTDHIRCRPVPIAQNLVCLINKSLPCQPCYPDHIAVECKGELYCLRDIDVNEVVERAREFLAKLT